MTTALKLDDRSPLLIYSPDGKWEQWGNNMSHGDTLDYNGTTTMTTVAGATVTLNFEELDADNMSTKGTSVAVYGALPHRGPSGSMGSTPQQTSYSIDHQSPYVFSPALTNNSQHQILFFLNNALPAANHTLVITSLSPGGAFLLDFVELTPVIHANPNDGKSHGSNHHPSSSENSNHSSDVGAIVGAIIGSLGLVLLAVCAFLALKYYRKKPLNITPEIPVYHFDTPPMPPPQYRDRY